MVHKLSKYTQNLNGHRHTMHEKCLSTISILQENITY